ncbi:hypothetical protein FY046_01150 [Erwinia sp. 1181_3]|uniref:hypothetical protein n=1 Tax=Erwinia sp. 1181_3 TaxID=2605957 RepID=UPI004058A472
MSNSSNSKNHKHTDHIIIIEDHAFKANADGMWNLTEIWQTLKLPKGKAPSEWKTKSAQRLTRQVKMRAARYANGHEYKAADKQATLKYAGWISEDFEDTVYAAFEAILEMPEVATVVANKMVELGYNKEAELIERQKDAHRYAMGELKAISSRVDGQQPARIYEAFKRGNVTKELALEMISTTSVWYKRVLAFEA